jgi:hypothetical protein
MVTARSAWLHRTALTTGPNAKRCGDSLNMLKQRAQPGGIVELDPRVTEQEPQKPRSTCKLDRLCKKIVGFTSLLCGVNVQTFLQLTGNFVYIIPNVFADSNYFQKINR